jgi:GTP cyclohydrolase I
MQHRLQAKRARLEVEFPYFIEKRAPVTGSPGMMSYTCRILGLADEHGVDLGLEVRVPIMTLCPCSKELSERGPHNQRGEVRVKVRFKRIVWIEDLIATVESCASSDLYALLKRPDEKHVADWAYEHPVFVEDVVRGVGTALLDDTNITWFSVEAETLESIHAHNAYAAIESPRENPESKPSPRPHWREWVCRQ